MGANFDLGGVTAIRFVERVRYPSDWWFNAHMHECYHMFCVLSGYLNLKIGSGTYACLENQALIVPPFTFHELEPQMDVSPELIEIMFVLTDSDDQRRLDERGYLADLDETSLGCIRQVEVYANSRNEKLRRRAYHFMNAALAQICTSPSDLDPGVLNAQFIDMSGFAKVTQEVVVYIDNNYKKQFTLDDIGQELGYSKSYLCTVFKRDTSSTINDYLNLVRICHFAEAFSFMDRDIAYICQHCGFTSVSHFNRTFKKFLGMSPRTYKQIRFPHFNFDKFDADIQNQAETYEKLKKILPRANAPASRIDVASFPMSSQQDE